MEVFVSNEIQLEIQVPYSDFHHRGITTSFAIYTKLANLIVIPRWRKSLLIFPGFWIQIWAKNKLIHNKVIPISLKHTWDTFQKKKINKIQEAVCQQTEEINQIEQEGRNEKPRSNPSTLYFLLSNIHNKIKLWSCKKAWKIQQLEKKKNFGTQDSRYITWKSFNNPASR